nr:MAG: RNA-directed DNA polymerase [Candidatus Kentron sp. TC]
MLAVYERVKGNKGAPGVDDLRVEELAAHLREHWPTIREELSSGTYTPQSVRKVEIPKPEPLFASPIILNQRKPRP